MSGGTRVGAVGLFALAFGGCGFGTPGGGSVMSSPLGDGGDTSGGSGDEMTATAAMDDGSGPAGDGSGGITGVGSITDPTDPTPDGTGTGQDGSTGEPIDGTTTGDPPDPCANPPVQHIAIEVSAATITAPMTTGTHPSHGVYAYSAQGGQGIVSFPFATDCEDTWRAWAFVYDRDPGFFGSPDPDSFDVWLDESGTTPWIYGCQTGGIFPPNWSWQTVNDTGLCAFENAPIEFTLAAGPHAMHFRNIESGSAGNGGDDPGTVAAMARIVITNDPSFSP